MNAQKTLTMMRLIAGRSTRKLDTLLKYAFRCRTRRMRANFSRRSTFSVRGSFDTRPSWPTPVRTAIHVW